MLLTEELDSCFAGTAIQRGWTYYRQRRVTLRDLAPGRATAHVRGSKRYVVQVMRGEKGELRVFCSCPAFRRRGPCKHLYATLLELDDSIHAGSWDPDPRGTEPRRPQALWRRRLEGFRFAIEARDPWQDISGSGIRPMFVIDVERTIDESRLRLLLRYRKRLMDGSWSLPKALRLDSTSEALRRLHDTTAKRLLNTAARLDGDGDPRYLTGPSDELRIQIPKTRALLEDLARHALLYRALDSSKEPEPIRLDEGPPWKLGLVFEVGADQSARIDARFDRGTEHLAITGPDLVLGCGLLLAKGVLHRVELFGGMEWVSEIRAGGPLEAPAKGRGELLRALIEGPGSADLPIAGIQKLASKKLRPAIDLDFEAQGRRVPCRILFHYGSVAVEPADPRVRIVDGARRGWFPRDQKAEREALARFLELGGNAEPAGEPPEGWVARKQALTVALALLEEGWKVSSRGAVWRMADRFEFRVKSGIDWFEVEGGVRFGDQTAAIPRILEALRAGRREVALPDGSLGLLPEKAQERLGLLAEIGSEREGNLRYTRSQGWILDALLDRDATVHADRRFRDLSKRIVTFDGVRALQERKGFRGALRPYQREALGWFEFLARMDLGGCLADDMGLGKTVMVLAQIHRRRRAGRKPSLVVAPRSLIWNWIEEAERFAPGLRVMDYTGTGRKQHFDAIAEHDLVVTTYGVLRRDAAKLKGIQFRYAILDEAQAIKNPASQGWKAARLLAADHRLALTGTPVENHLGDLWALMEFLNPGMLGGRKVFKAWSGAAGPMKADRARLAKAVRPVLLRRTKEGVLAELPAKTETTLHCEMGRSQAKAYRDLAAFYRGRLLNGRTGAPLQVLEALLRLRQIACHPGLVDAAHRSDEAAKLEALLPMLRELRESGHKALVFSQFTSFLAILRERLDEEGIAFTYLDGRTRKRKEAVDRFASDQTRTVFLISLKAGGVGLNLAAANYVFLLDPWWNPAVESQAIDRAHRIGQAKPVTAFRLVCRDTVEERILALQEKKRALADAIVRADAGPLQSLTRDDLAYLLGARGRA